MSLLSAPQIGALWAAETFGRPGTEAHTLAGPPAPSGSDHTAELVEYAAAERRAAVLVAGREQLPVGVPRAVLLLLPGAEVDKQQRLLVEYAADHVYQARIITNEAAAGLDLITAGLAEVLLVAFEPPGTAFGVVVDRVLAAGGRVEVVRPGRRRHQSRLEIAGLVVDMRRRGATVETIAHLLDLPQAAVQVHLRAGGLR